MSDDAPADGDNSGTATPPPAYPPPPPPPESPLSPPSPGYPLPRHPPSEHPAPGAQTTPTPGPAHSPVGLSPPAGRYRAGRGGPVDSLGRPMAEWWRRLVAFGIDMAVLAIPNSVIASAIAGSASA